MPSAKHDPVPSWRNLGYEFTQDTTFHGLRYITLYSRYCWRRLIWAVVVCAAIALLVYIVINNLFTYFGYPKAVNIEINYESPLRFPAVTVCNYNLHRLSALANLGLYDTMWEFYDEKDQQRQGEDVTNDTFTYVEGLCFYTLEEKLELLGSRGFFRPFAYTSAVACEMICLKMYDLDCAGFFYNRTTMSCEITTALIEADHPAIRNTSCPLESMEYYRRNRYTKYRELACNFDGSPNCDLTMNDGYGAFFFDDTWTISAASDTLRDHTLYSGTNGHYLMMRPSTNPMGRDARVHTKPILLNDSCVEFFYNIQGSYSSITMKVFTENWIEVLSLREGGHEEESSQEEGTWRRFFHELPDGLRMIAFDGGRGYSEEQPVYVAIDDITVAPCARFRAECRRFRKGEDYMGVVHWTHRGVNCLPWNSSYTDDGDASFPDGSPAAAENFCRNPDGDSSVWCLIEQYPYWEYCNVPYCDCRPDEFRCSKDGRCVPRSVMCDGVSDCDDDSDEVRECADRSIECEFNDVYMCGYQTSGSLAWQQACGRDVKDPIGPKRDLSSSLLGRFMYVDSRFGVEGDTARLQSPEATFMEGDCLHFNALMSFSPNGTEDRLRVYLNDTGRSGAGVHFLLLELQHWSKRNWVKFRLPLPSGTYRAIFEFVKGFPYQSVITIDSVLVTGCRRARGRPVSGLVSGESAACDFTSGDLCDYTRRSDQAFAIWTPIPEQFISSTGLRKPVSNATDPDYCSNVHLGSYGVMQSPSYPGTYSPNIENVCIGRVVGPPGSQVSLNFTYMDVETSGAEGMDCYYDKVQIYNKTASEPGEQTEPQHVICGYHRDYEVSGLSNDIALHFESDETVEHGGFRTYYNISLVPDMGYTLALVYYGHSSLATFTATLKSPTFHLESEACLSVLFQLKMKATLNVWLVGGTRSLLYSWKALEVGGSDDMSLWQEVKRTLDAEGDVHVMIEVTSTHHAGVLALIDNITMERESCQSLEEYGDLDCNFHTSGPYSCGYFDATQNIYAWERTQVPFTYYSGERVSKDVIAIPNSENIAWRLISPWTTVDEPSCLTVAYSSDWRANADILITRELRDVSFPTNLGWLPLLKERKHFTIRPPYESDDTEVTGMVRLAATPRPLRLIFTVQGSESRRVAFHWIQLSARACTEEDLLNHDIEMIEFDDNEVEIVTNYVYPESPPEPTYPDLIIPPPTQRKSVGAFHENRDMYLNTTHKKDDFIYGCRFHGAPCPADSISTTLTDFGVCYTFNDRSGANPLNTSKPGFWYGLQLTLNIEQYEHIHGPNTDAGIKIDLRDQDDVSSVRDLGMAAAMSSHTLFRIKHARFHSVGPPHGICGNQTLDIYRDLPYSRALCNLECRTKSLTDYCGCKDFFMDGDDRYCTVQESIDCIAKDWDTFPDSNDCTDFCLDPCKKIAFTVEPSSTTLSSLGVSKLLEKDTQNMSDELHNALNIQTRFDPELFYTLLIKMDAMLSSLELIKETLEKQAEGKNQRSPPYYRMEESIKSFLDIAQSDIDYVFRNVTQMKTEYDRLHGDQIDVSLAILNLALQRLMYLGSLAKYYRTNIFALESDSSDSSLRILLSLTSEVLSHIDHVLEVAKLNEMLWGRPHENIFIPSQAWPNRTLHESCRSMFFTVINEQFKENITELLNASSVGEFETTIQSFDYDSTVQAFQNEVATTIECSRHYQTFVDEVITWREGVDFHTYYNPLPDFNVEIQFLDLIQAIGNFSSMKSTFTQHKAPLSSFNEFTQWQSIATIVEVLVANMETHFATHMREAINQVQQAFPEIIMTALNKLITFQSFMGKKLSFVPDTRNMYIWRTPMLSFEETADIHFQHVPSDIWLVWPDDYDIETFASLQAKNVLDDIKAGVFDQLSDALMASKVEIDAMVAAITSAHDDLENYFLEYQKASAIDEEFVMKNFLRLDVYYGELTYQLIDQYPAYGLSNFFSDLGGYLGLLIGASVMTVCELLDLFIYNCVRKVQDRTNSGKRNKNEQDKKVLSPEYSGKPKSISYPVGAMSIFVARTPTDDPDTSNDLLKDSRA